MFALWNLWGYFGWSTNSVPKAIKMVGGEMTAGTISGGSMTCGTIVNATMEGCNL